MSLVLSLSGGMVSAAGMGIFWLIFGRKGWLGLVGLGIAGAVLHNAGQLCGVYLLLAATDVIWYQVPFMLLASLAFGALTGFFAYMLFPVLSKKSPATADFKVKRTGNAGLRCIAGLLLLAVSIGIVAVRSPMVLAVAALSASFLAFGAASGNIRVFLFPVMQFWLLFVFIAVMYLFFSYGHTVSGLPFVTYEGLRETMLQWLRLWTWLEISIVLTRLEFNRIALTAAIRWVPFGQATFIASLLALELFPSFVDLLRKQAKIDLKKVLHGSPGSISLVIEKLYEEMVKLVGEGTVQTPRAE